MKITKVNKKRKRNKEFFFYGGFKSKDVNLADLDDDP